MPTYTLGIPTANQSLGVTQQPIQDNFTVLNTTISVNHVAMNDSSGNQGKHKFVQMPTQGTSTATGAPATNNSEVAIYARSETGQDSGNINLYYRIQNQAVHAGTDILLTRFVTPSRTDATGVTFLTGGLIMQWGFKTVSASSSRVVTWNVAPQIVFPNATLNIQVTPFRPAASPGTTFGFWIDDASITTSGFTIINNSGHGFGFYWMAIGY